MTLSEVVTSAGVECGFVDGVEKVIDAFPSWGDTAVELPKRVPANQATKGLDRPDRATGPLI
jgi:hypothetical protein